MKIVKTTDGKNFRKLSRWIEIKYNLNPNKRNRLWYYVTDENGYRPSQDEFNPKDYLELIYFRFKGRNYALNQFYRIGSMVVAGKPHEYTDRQGTHVICAVDLEGDLYHPLYIEVNTTGEAVCVYEEVTKDLWKYPKSMFK